MNGYDYTNQAWVEQGVYVACAHPWTNCTCYGTVHQGEPLQAGVDFMGAE